MSLDQTKVGSTAPPPPETIPAGGTTVEKGAVAEVVGANSSALPQLVELADIVQRHHAELQRCLLKALHADCGSHRSPITAAALESAACDYDKLIEKRCGTQDVLDSIQNFRLPGELANTTGSNQDHAVVSVASQKTLASKTSVDSMISESAIRSPKERKRKHDLYNAEAAQAQLKCTKKAKDQFDKILNKRMVKQLNLDMQGANKFQNDNMHSKDYLTSKLRKEAHEHASWLEIVTTSIHYESATMILILANAIFVGWQVNKISGDAIERAKTGASQDDTAIDVYFGINLFFSIVFAVELGLRWYVDGLFAFFRATEWRWNVFDIIVVACSILELIIEGISNAHSDRHAHRLVLNLIYLRFLRIIRVVRLLHAVRTLNYFADLRVMLVSVFGSFKSILWVVLVFSLMLYVFGIAITIGAYRHLQTNNAWTDKGAENLRAHFGTVSRTCKSLYMGMSGGKDWGDFLEDMEDVSPAVQGVFVIFITFAVFAMVNVVTGIFVDSARKISENDRDLQIDRANRQAQAHAVSMFQLFREIDVNNSGTITLEEFEQGMEDERATAYLKSMELEFSEARILFVLLDINHSGSVEIEEFLLGCEKLKGRANAYDLAMVHHDIRYMMETVFELSEFMDQMLRIPVEQRIRLSERSERTILT